VATHAPHGEPHVQGPNPRPAPRDEGRFADVPLPMPPSFNERDVSDKPPFLQVPRLSHKEIDELQRRYDARLASLLAVDRLVARLVDEVRQRHALRRTWFIFTSDNGFMFGEHRLTRKNLLYDESARVPLIIRGPRGEFPRGAVRKQMTGNIDLSPTILDITGTEPLLEVDGLSLLPFAADRHFDGERDLLLENAKSSAVRTRHWMYAEHDTDGNTNPDAFELYNMKSDPYQLDNRYEDSLDPAAHPRLAATRVELEGRVDQLRDCAGHGPPDPCD
jgi:N-acetylglucosamine-6-sulfatase